MNTKLIQMLAAGAVLGAATRPLLAQGYTEAAAGKGVNSSNAAHAVTFTVRIENVSTPQTLKLSNGQTAPAPTAPGLWVVHHGGEPIFSTDRRDRGMGLEALAEDGDPTVLAGKIGTVTGVVTSGVFSIPLGDDKPGPILPGKVFEFTLSGSPGDRLSIAMMFGQSNDLFYAFEAGGIALFTNGQPVSGDLTRQFVLWDAGTEVNEEPGLGPNQGPRQRAPNTGTTEHAPVQLVSKTKDGFRYPAVGDVIRVTITPAAMAMSAKQ
jgi:hypothetical protein